MTARKRVEDLEARLRARVLEMPVAEWTNREFGLVAREPHLLAKLSLAELDEYLGELTRRQRQLYDADPLRTIPAADLEGLSIEELDAYLTILQRAAPGDVAALREIGGDADKLRVFLAVLLLK